MTFQKIRAKFLKDLEQWNKELEIERKMTLTEFTKILDTVFDPITMAYSCHICGNPLTMLENRLYCERCKRVINPGDWFT